MSNTATQTAPAFLREARISAGYASRDTAATGVPYSPETIGRHERGDVPIAPEDALVYAKGYNREDILLHYCASCPVGRATGKQATDRDLPFATLRLTQRLRKAAKEIATTLEDIADDGIVDDGERPVFDTALAALKELGETITDIVLYAASPEIEKTRPANAKASQSQQRYSITGAPQSQCQKSNKGGATE